MHHTQDLDARRLDAKHQPVLEDERLSPVGILKIGDHTSGERKVPILVRGSP